MVGNTDCKQVRVALHGPDSLEAEVSILGRCVFFWNPESLRVMFSVLSGAETG